jgi:O-antigen/teichoic acid export membrane protein
MVRYFEGAFRALENLLGLKVLVGISYLDLIILLSNTIKGETFTTIMLQMIVAKVTLILTLAFCFQKQHKIFKFMTLAEAISGVKEYQKRGISILGMPLGYLVINEASNVAVASILGLEMLGIFTVLKSLGGIFRQVSGIFTLSMMPKFTELITMQKFEIARKNLSNLKNFLIAVNSFILIILLFLFNVFSNNISKLELVGFNVYTIFLISAFLDIWWIIDSTILVSINQHQNLTVRFLFSASLGFLIGCSLMIQIGVSGMAIGTLVIDLALIPYSLRRKNTILKADHSE